MSPFRLSPFERRLGTLVLLLVLLACLAPPLAQSHGYHAFADTHTRWGLPHAFNVLSNLPFALVGAALLAPRGSLLRTRAGAAEAAMLRLTGIGLLLTALGSSWYHGAPDDGRLVADRLAMGIAFAGLLGLAGCRVSARAGLALAAVVLASGPAAVQAWSGAGNLTPWAVLQAGGLLVLALLAAYRPQAALPVRWWLLIAGYGLAKLLELGDHALWTASGEAISGHSLKHVVAALSVLPVLSALRLRRGPGQNAPQPPAQSA